MSRRRLGIAVLATLCAVLGPLSALAVGDGSGGVGLGETTTTTATATATTLTSAPTVITLGNTTLTLGQSTTETITFGSPTGTTTTGTGTGTTTTTTTAVAPPATIPAPAGSAFASRGMWVWELPATDGGNVDALITEAKRYGIGTLYIKSGDGSSFWSQFNPTLVAELHAAGLHACAWQYVYGISPALEAEVGAQAVADGADCLVIDAEAEYTGRYVQASTYITDLRRAIGSKFPVALAGLPYVDYHVGFPYSVFLGPGGAQFNMPQMYWQDIGTTVDAVYAHTYEFNEIYQRPIVPLGQVFDSPPVSQIKAFRADSVAYRSTADSWWDWQAASSRDFGALSSSVSPITGYVPNRTVAAIGPGAVGDLVRWAQQHLWNTHERVAIDGSYGFSTETAVKRFQSMHDLTATGIITPQTWAALLSVTPPRVTYYLKGKTLTARVAS